MVDINKLYEFIENPLSEIRARNYRDFDVTEKYGTPVDDDSIVEILRMPNDLKIAIHVYGQLVRSGKVDLRIRDKILEAESDYNKITNHIDLFELSLFLFSEKKWEVLASILIRYLDETDIRNFPEQSKIIYDLSYLTAHRLVIRQQKYIADKLKRYLKDNVSTMPKEQADFYRACDYFLENPLLLQRCYLSESVEKYQPHFALKGMCALSRVKKNHNDFYFDPTITIERLSTKERVLLVSSDIKYFGLYAQNFGESLKSISPDIGLHIHCVDFEPPKLFLERSDCGLSYEFLPPHLCENQASERHRRTYFASARFLVIEELQRYYDFLWVSDIDGKITKNILSFPPASINLHSAVGRNLGLRLPMELISAANVSVKSDECGAIFAKYLRNYILSRLQTTTEPIWYLDQIALFCAWQDLRKVTHLLTDLAPFFYQKGNWSLTRGNAMKREAFK